MDGWMDGWMDGVTWLLYNYNYRLVNARSASRVNTTISYAEYIIILGILVHAIFSGIGYET